MDEALEIYFEDLTPNAQKVVLDYLGVNTKEEINADVFPLFLLNRPEPTSNP